MSEKLEVLDLIIKTLTEHERKLSLITDRLDEIARMLGETVTEHAGRKAFPPMPTALKFIPPPSEPPIPQLTSEPTRNEAIPETPQPMPEKTREDSMTNSVTKEAGGREKTGDLDRFVEACKRVALENFVKLLREWGMLDIFKEGGEKGDKWG